MLLIRRGRRVLSSIVDILIVSYLESTKREML
jgi:hypothetical protein